MGAVSSASAIDTMLFAPTRFALRYAKSWDNRHEPSCTKDDSINLFEEAFGHPGSGGSIGFADLQARMSFGYPMNKMGQGLGLNTRGQSLVDGTYLSLGSTMVDPKVKSKKVSLERYPFLHGNNPLRSRDASRHAFLSCVHRRLISLLAASYGSQLQSHRFPGTEGQSTQR